MASFPLYRMIIFHLSMCITHFINLLDLIVLQNIPVTYVLLCMVLYSKFPLHFIRVTIMTIIDTSVAATAVTFIAIHSYWKGLGLFPRIAIFMSQRLFYIHIMCVYNYFQGLWFNGTQNGNRAFRVAFFFAIASTCEVNPCSHSQAFQLESKVFNCTHYDP